jgi:hypothetical protein
VGGSVRGPSRYWGGGAAYPREYPKGLGTTAAGAEAEAAWGHDIHG